MEILIQVAVRLGPHALETRKNEENLDKATHFNNQHIFNTSKDSQNKIYSDTIQPLVSHYLDGYDISIVKYGQKNIFYENEHSSNFDGDDCKEDDTSDTEDEEDGGIVHKFIKQTFAELISTKKECHYIFSIGWTEINEHNQLLDLLNGAGLIQCFTISQLFEALSIGLSNRNNSSCHNILSIMLEQQFISASSAQHKLSTINFCDLNYGADKILTNNSQLISEPKDLPTNFYSGAPQTGLDNLQYQYQAGISPTQTNPSTQQQCQKLLKNAEKLFAKLNINELSEGQRKEIDEWLFLKSECDNYSLADKGFDAPFYGGNIVLPPPQPSSLLPILEMDENNVEDEELNNQDENYSDNGSYIDMNDHNNHLYEKISCKIKSFNEKTDRIIKIKYHEYFEKHPKVLSSDTSSTKNVDNTEGTELLKTSSTSSEQYFNGGRRRSIRETLNDRDLHLIRKVAAATEASKTMDEEDLSEEKNNSKLDELRKNLSKSIASIDNTKMQINAVEGTILEREKMIAGLIDSHDTRATAKLKLSKKKGKLEAEYEKCKKHLSKAILSGKDAHSNKLKKEASVLEERLMDLTSINQITSESNKKIKQEQNSLQETKKKLEALNKVLKKDLKHRDAVEKEILSLKNKKLKAIEAPGDTSSELNSTSDNRLKIRDVNARISHLNDILKEKSSNLLHCDDSESKEMQSLRHEIRNLRRTRNVLQDQKISLCEKLKREKSLTYKEERKMLECDEAIEAIDEAIEMKNELICGHKSIDIDDGPRKDRKKGEQLLMSHLNKLSMEEMRTLLYKYYLKVIDLKESSKKLEHHLTTMEREKDAWEWREKILTNAIRQARLESERNIVIQQKNHETRLNLLLRHFANETATSSLNDGNFLGEFDTSTSTSAAMPDFGEMNIVKATKRLTQHNNHHTLDNRHYGHHHQMAMEKFDHHQVHHQDKDRDIKNKLFTKFHVLTRYHQENSASTSKGKELIPQENLKQLTAKKSSTKVTRQKNKLIIQAQDGDG